MQVAILLNHSNGLDIHQSIKGGYLFQVKDRLFDSRPFFINTLSNSIKLLPPDQIFAPENFTNINTGVQFGELNGISFRYMANTIMNAGYIQFDNQFSKSLRVIWGLRVEDFDQFVGSVKTIRSPPCSFQGY